VLKQFICGTCSLGEVEEFISKKLTKNLVLEKLLSEEAQVLQVLDNNKLVFDARLGPRTREIYMNLKNTWCKDLLRSAVPTINEVIERYSRIVKCEPQGIIIAYSNILQTLYVLIHPEERCSALRVSYNFKTLEYEALMSLCKVSSRGIECENEVIAEGLKQIIAVVKSFCY